MAKSSGRNRYLRRGGGGAARQGGPQGNQLAEAQAMLQQAQEQLAATKVEGSAGGGAVRVTMTGDQKIEGVKIEPDVLDPDDVEMLEDLIVAAINDASERASALQADSFGPLTGGLNLPGLGG